MSTVDTVLGLLDKWPMWRRITATPDRVDALEKRIADIEQKLGDKWPADVCRFCGARAARLSERTRANDQGVYREMWSCSECGETEPRSFKVG